MSDFACQLLSEISDGEVSTQPIRYCPVRLDMVFSIFFLTEAGKAIRAAQASWPTDAAEHVQRLVEAVRELA